MLSERRSDKGGKQGAALELLLFFIFINDKIISRIDKINKSYDFFLEFFYIINFPGNYLMSNVANLT